MAKFLCSGISTSFLVNGKLMVLLTTPKNLLKILRSNFLCRLNEDDLGAKKVWARGYALFLRSFSW